MSLTVQKLTAAERFNQLVERRKQTDTHWIEAAKDSIADEIYDLMKQEGVTKSELAERMGVSRQYITKMLQGGTNLTIETMVKIGLALGYRLREGSFYVAMEEQGIRPATSEAEMRDWLGVDTYQGDAKISGRSVKDELYTGMRQEVPPRGNSGTLPRVSSNDYEELLQAA